MITHDAFALCNYSWTNIDIWYPDHLINRMENLEFQGYFAKNNSWSSTNLNLSQAAVGFLQHRS